MNYYTKNTSVGIVTITEEFGFVTALYFEQKKFKSRWDKYILSGLLNIAFNELEEYLNGNRRIFDIPLNPKGTSYQQKVWSLIFNTPYGQTKTYKDLSIELGNINSSRAVGIACNRNPIPIFIPCHRIIGSNGGLKGYIGGLEIKRKLLSIEKFA